MQWYPAARPREKKVARADAEGRFELVLPEPGAWIVHANVQGKGTTNRGQRWLFEFEPGAKQDLELDLRGADLVGAVVDGFGAPLAGMRMELRTVAGAPHQPMPTMGGGMDTTDEEGRFAFALLEPGTYVVIAQGSQPGSGTHGAVVSHEVTVEGEGEFEVGDLVIPAGMSFAILVEGEDGRPVSGASLYFHDGAGVPLNPTSWTRSSGEGRATSPAFGPGPIWVTAVHSAGASASVRVMVGEEESVTLTTGRAHWIELDQGTGWVDPTTAHIAVVDAAGRRWGGLIDVRGLFEAKPPREKLRCPLFGPLPPGTYQVRVEGPGGAVKSGSVRLGPSSPRGATVPVQ